MNGLLPDSLKNALKKFRLDADYKEFLRAGFFALLIRVSGIFTGFLVTLFTARFFGADALGIVAICLAVLSFASVFGKLGLDVAIIKFIPAFAARKNYSAIKGVYLNALKLILPLTILISLLLFLFAPWMAINIFHKPYLSPLLRINACVTLPLVFLLINSECIRALKKTGTYTFLQTVSVSLFACVLLLIFSTINREKEIPAYIQFSCIFLSGFLSIILWSIYSKASKHKAVSETPIRDLLRTSMPMFTTTIMQLTMSWAATLILAAYVDEKEVGIYNALVRISVFTNITILAVNSLAMPRFAEAFSNNSISTMRSLAELSSRLIFISSLPLFFLLAFFPSWILSIFGKEFPGHETALYVLLAGQFIVCFAGLPSQILSMAGRQHSLRNIAIISAIINVVCCFLLIPKFGIMGACYAQLAGTFSWNLLSTFSVKRYFGFTAFFRF